MIDNIINSLGKTEKITKFALDFEQGIGEIQFEMIIDILSKKYSNHLQILSFSKSNNKTLTRSFIARRIKFKVY